jgi:glutamate racemase
MSFQIGLVDWGIGGLGVYKELRKELKSNSYVYLSDSGFMPYGKVPKAKLIRRLNQVIDFFRQKNIRTVVVACNAASTVLTDLQKKNPDMKLYGMLEAGKKLIQKSKKNYVLVLGGRRTIECGFFQKEFKNSKINLQALVAQPLSGLIERGQHDSKKFHQKVLFLKKQINNDPAVVLLACTHYPAASQVFKKHFPESLILDPAMIVVSEIKKNLKKTQTEKTRTQFFTTGSARQSKISALKAFGLKIPSFKKVVLS